MPLLLHLFELAPPSSSPAKLLTSIRYTLRDGLPNIARTRQAFPILDYIVTILVANTWVGRRRMS